MVYNNVMYLRRLNFDTKWGDFLLDRRAIDSWWKKATFYMVLQLQKQIEDWTLCTGFWELFWLGLWRQVFLLRIQKRSTRFIGVMMGSRVQLTGLNYRQSFIFVGMDDASLPSLWMLSELSKRSAIRWLSAMKQIPWMKSITVMGSRDCP